MAGVRAVFVLLGTLCLIFAGFVVLVGPGNDCGSVLGPEGNLNNDQALCAQQAQSTGEAAIAAAIAGVGFMVGAAAYANGANRMRAPMPPPPRPGPPAAGPPPYPSPPTGPNIPNVPPRT